MKSKRGRKGPSAAAIASSKGGKATATAAVALDTSLWEQLLAGGGAATTAPVAAKHSKLPAPKPGSAPRPDKLPTKKKKQVPAVGNFAKSVTNNWNMLLAGGGSATAGAAAAATATPDNGLASSGKNKGKKAKKGGKRPRSEIGQGSSTSSGAATTTPDFFSAKRPGNGVSGVTSNSGKKRKRAVVGGGAGPPDAAAGGSTGSASLAGTGGKHRKEPKRSDVGDGSKRPRSNALNLAFQAQKEQAAAAAAATEGAGAAGVAGAHKGGNKGRGKGRAGGKGGSEKPLTAAEKAQYVALDCEMVGVGPGGCRSALARCCLVDWDGNTIYDKHVTPNERVTDFRTFVSGVKANHLKGGLRLRQCQEEVAAILKGKILVGHALHNDLKALMMSHPQRATRDTATYRPYQKAHGKAGGKLRPRSLKLLAQDHLDRSIQSGQHSPAEDAKAAMDLYRLARFEWEKSLSAAGKMRGRRAIVDQQG